MATIRLYPSVKVARQSFKGVKKCTVPNQSMSIREILQRFVKRESLPVARNGVYEERFGDLEKISKADITEQFEAADEFKAVQKKFKKQEQDKYDKAEAARKAKELTDKQIADAALLKPPHTPTEGKSLP